MKPTPTAFPLLGMLATLLLGAGAGPVAYGVEIVGGTAEDRQRMEEISREWVDAYARGDLDGIMSLMHPDSIVMPHNQPTSTGLDEVRAYFGSRIGRPGVSFVDNLEEIRINGTWAVVLGSFKVEVHAEEGADPVVVHNGRYLVLYEKVDGDWLMLRDMDNLDPVAAE
jgi:ketosteroid isomerase-like protein